MRFLIHSGGLASRFRAQIVGPSAARDDLQRAIHWASIVDLDLTGALCNHPITFYCRYSYSHSHSPVTTREIDLDKLVLLLCSTGIGSLVVVLENLESNEDVQCQSDKA